MLRIGVIGTGSIAAVHLDGWRQMPGIELVGYYDILPEAAERAAQKYGGQVFACLEDLFAAVDLVDICTPGTAHKENVLAAAAARQGHHLREAAGAPPGATRWRWSRRASAAGVPLFPAQVVRFFPSIALVKEQHRQRRASAQPGVYPQRALRQLPAAGQRLLTRPTTPTSTRAAASSSTWPSTTSTFTLVLRRGRAGLHPRADLRRQAIQDHALITLRFTSAPSATSRRVGRTRAAIFRTRRRGGGRRRPGRVGFAGPAVAGRRAVRRDRHGLPRS